jgi:tRNA dimethylallyltransferase
VPDRAADPPPLLAVVGPTASGKSRLALDLAQRLNGEILCCDSVQVYRGLDVGSAKPTPAERALVPHHLLDLVDPDEPFHAARWASAARVAIAEVRARGHLPILVGGTGLYFRALLRGLFEAPPPDPAIRARHQQEAHEQGVPALHRRLTEIDPEAAARIRTADLLRISRALEVFEQTGVPLSALHRAAPPPPPIDCFGVLLDPPQDELRRRVATRVDQMLAAGWLDEIRALRAAGFGAARALQSLGYRQLGQFLDGELALEAAVTAAKQATAGYARRQRTWFRSETMRLRLQAAADAEPVLASVAAWLDLR